MVSKSTLYLNNLPTRPKNKQNFIKTLLKQFNPNNGFSNHALIIPDQRFDVNPSTALLDESLGIVSIARSQSVKLKNKCFITFDNDSSAQDFKQKFQHMKIMGKCISITNARKNSYMTLAKENPKLLGKILKSKQLKTIQNIEDPLNLKRKLRRLRNKLKSKSVLKHDEIDKIVEEYRIKLLQKNVESNLSQTSKKKTKQKSKFKTRTKPQDKIPSSNKISTSTETQPTTKKANVSENPPNKTLLVQDLPNDIDEQSLIDIFQSDGFTEIRMVSVRHLAFVEYDSVDTAKHVLHNLGSIYTLKDQDHQISIGYAK